MKLSAMARTRSEVAIQTPSARQAPRQRAKPAKIRHERRREIEGEPAIAKHFDQAHDDLARPRQIDRIELSIATTISHATSTATTATQASTARPAKTPFVGAPVRVGSTWRMIRSRASLMRRVRFARHRAKHFIAQQAVNAVEQRAVARAHAWWRGCAAAAGRRQSRRPLGPAAPS